MGRRLVSSTPNKIPPGALDLSIGYNYTLKISWNN
jgi:hypothetical protein